MDEFIENFNEFRDWLNTLSAPTQEAAKIITNIQNKFDKLGLNNIF